MNKLFKIFIFIIISLLLILCLSYIFLFQKIDFNSSISNSKEIKNLDKKIFWSFGYNKPEKNSTDYSDIEYKNDTISYTFEAQLNQKFNQIAIFRLNQSTGFGGNTIEIIKLGNRFKIEINDSSDNDVQNKPNKGYKILSKSLTLDKDNYKINDSIFGKIEIKFQNKNNNSISESKGFFRGKIK